MTERWHTGNAAEDGADTRGWFVGHFIDPSKGVLSTKDVEVKWATHPKGDCRPDWTSDDQRTTLVMLISGLFRVESTDGEATFARQGDYAMWGPGVDHSWEALEDSVVLTVRWPSSRY
ncbi:signal peptidase I [Amycolatopsis cynarae]|uniref:Signal peptidase I n=1 Tax=Amycolatopsis cynarae TaxID=2995223 RepID=A0ABY7B0R4_9PSEU|nr:signal peptidase I [Amycolatopsis sp. HUAS 11-8]WAL64501.1 signal peptidase I [Amycolatopsis sp. HUAS 11-8]